MTDKEKKAFLGRYRQIAAEEAAIWEEVSYWVSRSCLEETATLADFLAKTVCRKETAGRGVTGQGIENRKETGGQTIRQEGAAQIESIKQSGAEQVQDTKGAQAACSKAAVRRQEGALQKEGTGVKAGTLGQARLSEQSHDEEVEGLEQMLRQKAGQLLGVRKEIERAIGAVENDTYRLLLRYRYIQGDTFEKIAERMHYSSRQVMNLHSAALGACQILEGTKEIA